MGFWHTSYMDFHDRDWNVDIPAFVPEYPCADCDEIFLLFDDLRSHRFENHARRRPLLFLRGHEVGGQPINITAKLEARDIAADCDEVFLNGDPIPVQTLPRTLAANSWDTCDVRLVKTSITSTFTLNFRIADLADLQGIEQAFQELVRGGRLDGRAVEEFIRKSSDFGTAIGYCDGICAYLYGVLAKERDPDSSTLYEQYVNKFNFAADRLREYDRQLARTIGGLIAFHFNQFSGVLSLGTYSRVGEAAARFDGWLRGDPSLIIASNNRNKIDRLITDLDTERLLNWSVMPLRDLFGKVNEMSSLIEGEMAEYDRVKLRILISETNVAGGCLDEAKRNARTLRNLPTFEAWAESILKMKPQNI